MLRKLYVSMLAAFVLLAFQGGVTPALASGGGGEKEATGPQYVELDPLLLPIIDDKGISQQVSLIVKLEVADPAKAEEVKSMLPKIVDAFVQDLYGTLNTNNAYMANGILRLDLVKARLKKTASAVVEGDTITDVLLQVVQQHRV